MTAGQALAQAQIHLGWASQMASQGDFETCSTRALLAIAYLLDAIAVELGVSELPTLVAPSAADTSTAPATTG